VYERRRRLLGDEHAETIAALLMLVNILRREGRLDASEDAARAGLAALEASPRRGDPDASDVMWALARTLLLRHTNEGDGEAEELLRTCVALRTDAPAPKPVRIAIAESELAGCLLAEERYDEAEPLLVKSNAVLRADRAEFPVLERECLQRLVQL